MSLVFEILPQTDWDFKLRVWEGVNIVCDITYTLYELSPIVETSTATYRHVFSVICLLKNLEMGKDKLDILHNLPKLLKYLETKGIDQATYDSDGQLYLVKDIAISDGLSKWEYSGYSVYAKDALTAKLKIKEKVLDKLMENEEDTNALTLLSDYKKWEVEEVHRPVVSYVSQKEVCQQWVEFLENRKIVKNNK